MPQLLSDSQLRLIEQIIKDHYKALAISVLGVDQFDADEVQRLVDQGLVDLDTAQNYPRLVYLFGRVVEEIGAAQAGAMSYEELISYLEEAPPTLDMGSRQVIDTIVREFQHDIDKLAGRVEAGIKDDIIEEESARRVQMRLTRQILSSAVENRQSAEKIARKIEGSTPGFNQQWYATMSARINNALIEGQADEIERQSELGRNARVFKRPQPDACFPPGTAVTTSKGPVPIEELKVGDRVLTHKLNWKKVTKVHCNDFEGNLSVLETENATLKATPNHPVLSDMEWLDAEAVEQGSQVVTLRIIRDSDYQPTVLSEERLLLKMPLSEPSVMPVVCPVKLYGNLVSRDSNIDVKFVYSKLRNNLKTSFFQKFSKFLGVWRHSRQCLLSSLRFFSLGFRGHGLFTGYASISGEPLPVFGGHFSKSDLVVFRPRSERDPILQKTTFYKVFSNTKLGRQLSEESSLLIGRDDVSNIDIFSRHHSDKKLIIQTQEVNAIAKEQFNGKVYNLSVEEDESYFANGIAVHNCEHCKRLYLEKDGKTPKVFDLAVMRSFGTNVGLKKHEWKPVLGSCHPQCRCVMSELPPDFVFDEDGSMVLSFGTGPGTINP